ncbi:hypothetical protein F5B20DRAFT_597417 [Whalleya microplaca]|nr:hypothetical protein F5B20DRAFT_597417 [Whalleya microplaca]
MSNRNTQNTTQADQRAADGSATQLTKESLSQLSFTSNVAHYEKQDHSFERSSLGLSSRRQTGSQMVSDWELQWKQSTKK